MKKNFIFVLPLKNCEEVLQVREELSEQQQDLDRVLRLLGERTRNSETLTVFCLSEQQQEVQNGQVLRHDQLQKNKKFYVPFTLLIVCREHKNLKF